MSNMGALRQHGAAPKADRKALWRRIVFNILISDTDNHLRNHGFLYQDSHRRRVSPACDLNPVPTDIKPRTLTAAINININEDDSTASLALAKSAPKYFELDPARAHEIAAQVGKFVSKVARCSSGAR